MELVDIQRSIYLSAEGNSLSNISNSKVLDHMRDFWAKLPFQIVTMQNDIHLSSSQKIFYNKKTATDHNAFYRFLDRKCDFVALNWLE